MTFQYRSHAVIVALNPLRWLRFVGPYRDTYSFMTSRLMSWSPENGSDETNSTFASIAERRSGTNLGIANPYGMSK